VPNLPAPITPLEAQERGHSTRRSGFADPNYWTEERRQKQREWAKKAIQEGRFGGKKGQGGRPRIKTATEIVAEEAQKSGAQIARRLKDIALNNPDPRRAIEAMDRLLGSEQTVEKNKREDERELMKMEGDELNTVLLERLAELTDQPFDVESTAEEVPDDEIEAYIKEHGGEFIEDAAA
jgi:hypothetical protein